MLESSATSQSSGTGRQARTRALVVGGGVCGLAAAWRLASQRPWWKVALVEQAPTCGGLASTWDVAGWRIDLGPHRWFTELHEMKRLEPELLPNDLRVKFERRSQMVLGDKIIEYPPDPRDILKKLGVVTTLKIGGSFLLEKLSLTLDDPKNFHEAMRRNYGNVACRLIVDKYAEKVWKTPATELSREIARVRASASKTLRPDALREIEYFRGGIDALPRNLEKKCVAAGVKLMTDMRMTDIHSIADTYGQRIISVEMSDRNNNNETTEFEVDHVISTMPIVNLSPMLGISQTLTDPLKFLGMVLVAVEISKPSYSPNAWVYYPDNHLIFNRSYEPSKFDESQQRADATIVVFDITSRTNEYPWTATNDEILDCMYEQLTKHSLIEPDDIVSMHIRRVPYAYPLYELGYEAHLSALLDEISAYQNLVSTGRQGLFNHNNMDHSMIMGITAADCVADNKYPAQQWYNETLDTFKNYRIVD